MLSVKNLTKAYGKNLANQDISFSIEENSVNLLVGPNGAGKSTLIMSILGLLRYAGEVKIDGFDNRSVEAKQITGYMPEIPHLYPLLTISEHLEFVARVYKLKDWQTRGDQLLDRFDLADKTDKLGGQLSKGMQQKLSLITAILPQPRLLLVDEPLIGLDPPAIIQAKQVFSELAQAGTTLLISTHILDTVDQLWDRTLIMQDGLLKAVVDRDYLKARGLSLEEFFLQQIRKPHAETGDSLESGRPDREA